MQNFNIMTGRPVSYAHYGAMAGAALGWILAVVFGLLPFWTVLFTLGIIFGVKSPGLDIGSVPQKILIIVLFTLTLEGLLFGAEIAERSFPTFEEPTEDASVWQVLVTSGANFVKAVWGGLLFFMSLLTFGLPDVPWWIRIPVGGTIAGLTIWSIIEIIRGSRASG